MLNVRPPLRVQDLALVVITTLAIWLLNIVNSGRHRDREAIGDKVQEKASSGVARRVVKVYGMRLPKPEATTGFRLGWTDLVMSQ